MGEKEGEGKGLISVSFESIGSGMGSDGVGGRDIFLSFLLCFWVCSGREEGGEEEGGREETETRLNDDDLFPTATPFVSTWL